jgi:hypothetical protein
MVVLHSCALAVGLCCSVVGGGSPGSPPKIIVLGGGLGACDCRYQVFETITVPNSCVSTVVHEHPSTMPKCKIPNTTCMVEVDCEGTFDVDMVIPSLAACCPGPLPKGVVCVNGGPNPYDPLPSSGTETVTSLGGTPLPCSHFLSDDCESILFQDTIDLRCGTTCAGARFWSADYLECCDTCPG